MAGFGVNASNFQYANGSSNDYNTSSNSRIPFSNDTKDIYEISTFFNSKSKMKMFYPPPMRTFHIWVMPKWLCAYDKQELDYTNLPESVFDHAENMGSWIKRIAKSRDKSETACENFLLSLPLSCNALCCSSLSFMVRASTSASFCLFVLLLHAFFLILVVPSALPNIVFIPLQFPITLHGGRKGWHSMVLTVQLSATKARKGVIEAVAAEMFDPHSNSKFVTGSSLIPDAVKRLIEKLTPPAPKVSHEDATQKEKENEKEVRCPLVVDLVKGSQTPTEQNCLSHVVWYIHSCVVRQGLSERSEVYAQVKI